MTVFGGIGYALGDILAERDVDRGVAATERVFSLATVEERTVSESVVLTGEGIPGSVVSVTATTPPGAARAVVTHSPLAAGDKVTSGTFLGAVSGRPVFALAVHSLPYRDLARGSEGTDVVAIQRALTAIGYDAGDSGRWDWNTERALSQFYQDRGFIAPGGQMPVFALPEFMTFVDEQLTIATITPVNTVLEEGAAFATLQASQPVVVARANLLEAASFEVGAEVIVQGAGWTAPGTVLTIGDFAEEEGGQSAGVDVTVRVDPVEGSIEASRPYTITATGTASTGPAVPLAAIRQSTEGTFVVTEDAGLRSDVSVQVLTEGDGWALLGNSVDLPIGATVVIE